MSLKCKPWMLREFQISTAWILNLQKHKKLSIYIIRSNDHLNSHKTRNLPGNLTFISALGPNHWPVRPFGPKNECLDKVSFFGRGILRDLHIPKNQYHPIHSHSSMSCAYIVKVHDTAFPYQNDNLKFMCLWKTNQRYQLNLSTIKK